MHWHSSDRLRSKIIPITLLILSLLLILLLSSSLSTVQLRPGGDLNVFAVLMSGLKLPTLAMPAAAAPAAETPALGWLRTLFWILLPLTLIYAFFSPRYRRQLLRTLVLVVVLVFFIERLRRVMNAEKEGMEEFGLGALPQTVNSATLPPLPDFVSSTPDWAVWTINVLLAAAMVGLVWFLWRRFRPLREEDPQAAVVQEAKAAIYELELGGDLREVILRCYAQMSRVLRADRNIHRHRAMTPREFEQHLAERGFSDENIARLTRLFESVRYSNEEPGPAAKEEAVSALTAIVREYGSTARREQMAAAEPVGSLP